MAKPKKHFLIRCLLLALLPAAWCVLGEVGLLDFLENKLLDSRFRFRGEKQAPINVVYVDVDAASTADLGNQPWDRSFFVEVGRALLTAGKARAIGIDYIFSEKGKPQLVDDERFRAGTRQLGLFLRDNPQVIVAAGYAAASDRDVNEKTIIRELPRVRGAQAKAEAPEKSEFRHSPHIVWDTPVGLIDTLHGGTRWVPTFAPAEKHYYHMAVQLARVYWGLDEPQLQVFPDRLEMRRVDGAVQAAIPLKDGQDVQVNWFSRWHSPGKNHHESFVQVLALAQMLNSEKPEEKSIAVEYFKRFEDSVVLIGPVDPLLHDLSPTPFDAKPVPRVGIHGNLLKTIVSGEYLREVSPAFRAALVFLLTGLVCALAAFGSGRNPVWRAGSVLLLAAYVGLAYLVFARSHLVLPMTAPIGAAFTTSFATVIWQLVAEEKQKSRIKGMFGTYVSPQLVSRLIESGEDPKLGGAEVEITAYFSDIENFSAFSEQLSPARVVELMNEYLTAATDIITAQGGTLDKYIGDAVVAMFGAPVAMPDHAYRACVSSQLVQRRLGELRRKWGAEAGKWPEGVTRMHTRIGLNSGRAVVGNMGSLTRFNYTMMGDNVNLGARMESGARTYGAATLVTEATKAAAEKFGERCVFRFLDRIVVKGRTQPVSIYELAGLQEHLPQSAHDCIAVFGRALDHYFRQDWVAARALFQKAAELEWHQTTGADQINPSLLYLKRCELMKLNPPGKDWDGVYVMRSK